jgi:hypothetical protein
VIAPSRRCPRIEGLFGKPTVINNVLTLATVPVILDKGAEHYRDFGMGRSRGTMPIQLAGNIKHGGLFENRVRHHAARTDRRYRRRHSFWPAVRAVQVGGPLGAYFPARCSIRRSITRPSPRAKADRPRRHRGVRRHRRSGEAGALRHGILRHRIVRQVHALPHRLDARRGGVDRIIGAAKTAPRTSRCSKTSATP